MLSGGHTYIAFNIGDSELLIVCVNALHFVRIFSINLLNQPIYKYNLSF